MSAILQIFCYLLANFEKGYSKEREYNCTFPSNSLANLPVKLKFFLLWITILPNHLPLISITREFSALLQLAVLKSHGRRNIRLLIFHLSKYLLKKIYFFRMKVWALFRWYDGERWDGVKRKGWGCKPYKWSRRCRWSFTVNMAFL